MYTQTEIVNLQRIHIKYFHEKLSERKTIKILKKSRINPLAELVRKLRDWYLYEATAEDDLWLENLGRFVKEVEEEGGLGDINLDMDF